MSDSIKIMDLAGGFAENKEIARRLRLDVVLPALRDGRSVIFDFQGVTGATQSFVHALVSDPIRKFGDGAYDNLYYENANDDIRKIVSIVYRYMQESLDT